MAKSDEEYVKYVTEQVVKFIDTPREVRKQVKAERKQRREPWSTRWFGMIPLTFSIWAGRFKRKSE